MGKDIRIDAHRRLAAEEFAFRVHIAHVPRVAAECAHLRKRQEHIDLYRDIALEMKLGFCDASKWNIPLAYDGVHFTEAGHRLFAQQLYDYLRKGESLCWKLE